MPSWQLTIAAMYMEGNMGLTLAVSEEDGTPSMTDVDVSMSTPSGPWCPSLQATCSSS